MMMEPWREKESRALLFQQTEAEKKQILEAFEKSLSPIIQGSFIKGGRDPKKIMFRASLTDFLEKNL